MASVANLLLGPPDLMPPGGDWAVGSVAATVGAVWVAALPGFAGRVVVEKVEGPSTRAPGRAHRLADGGASAEGGHRVALLPGLCDQLDPLATPPAVSPRHGTGLGAHVQSATMGTTNG